MIQPGSPEKKSPLLAVSMVYNNMFNLAMSK